MSRLDDATARILQLERQRDELQRVNFKMRDALLAYAKECIKCDGTGCVPFEDDVFHEREVVRTVPCPVCYDLRELIDP